MRRDQALLMIRVVAGVVAVGVLLYVPVLIEETDEFDPGLLFLTLLLTGFMAGFPVLISAVVHGWTGRPDTWTSMVASSAVVVAVLFLLAVGGRPGNLLPTALVLIGIYAAIGFLGGWIARRVAGDDPAEGVSAER